MCCSQQIYIDYIKQYFSYKSTQISTKMFFSNFTMCDLKFEPLEKQKWEKCIVT